MKKTMLNKGLARKSFAAVLAFVMLLTLTSVSIPIVFADEAPSILSGNNMSEYTSLYSGFGQSVTGAECIEVTGCDDNDGAKTKFKDGSVTKNWFTAVYAGTTATATFDLKGTYSITRTDLWDITEGGRGIGSYTVSVSDDNEAWTEVGSHTSNYDVTPGTLSGGDYVPTSGSVVHMGSCEVESASGRYVKITATRMTGKPQMAFAEIVIMGTISSKALLESEIEKAKAMDVSIFTSASVAALNDVIKAGEDTLADDSAADIDYKDATDAIKTAIKNLVVSPDVKKTILSDNNLSQYADMYKDFDSTASTGAVCTEVTGCDDNNGGKTKIKDGKVINDWFTSTWAGKTASFTFDLKNTMYISRVDLWDITADGFRGIGDFKVELSVDGEDWIEAGSHTNDYAVEKDDMSLPDYVPSGSAVHDGKCEFTPVSAKYVRVTANLLSGKSQMGFAEMVICGYKNPKADLVKELTTLIAEAKALDTSIYTADSIGALASAVAAGEDVLKKTDATIDELKDAVSGIKEAMKNLKVSDIAKKVVLSDNKISQFADMYKDFDSASTIGATCTAVTGCDDNDGAKTKIKDGKIINDWFTGSWQGKVGTFTFDLSKECTINRVDLWDITAQSYHGIADFTVEVSTDGEDWIVAGSHTNNYAVEKDNMNLSDYVPSTSSVHDGKCEFAPVSARYVRVTANLLSGKNQMGFAEIVICGFKSPKDTLKDEIANAEETLKNVTLYKTEGVNKLKEAVAKGKTAYESTTSTAKDIADAIEAIKTAKAGLTPDERYTRYMLLDNNMINYASMYEAYPNSGNGAECISFTGADDNEGAKSKIKDGKILENWFTGIWNNAQATAVFDLKSDCYLSRVDLWDNTSQTYMGTADFTVEVSTDNEHWTVAGSHTNNYDVEKDNTNLSDYIPSTAAVHDGKCEFAPIPARYVRITTNKLAGKSQMTFAEVVMLGYKNPIDLLKSKIASIDDLDRDIYVEEDLGILDSAKSAAEAVAQKEGASADDIIGAISGIDNALSQLRLKYEIKVLSNNADKAIYPQGGISTSLTYTYSDITDGQIANVRIGDVVGGKTATANSIDISCTRLTDGNPTSTDGGKIIHSTYGGAVGDAYAAKGTAGYAEAVFDFLSNDYYISQVDLYNMFDGKGDDTVKRNVGDYSVAVSTDGKTFKTVGSKITDTTGAQPGEMYRSILKLDTPVKARYVKVSMTRQANKNQMVLGEIVLLGFRIGSGSIPDFEFKDLTFVDGNDNPITTFEGVTDIYIDGKVFSHASETKPVMVVGALFDDEGRLVKISSSSLPVTKGSEASFEEIAFEGLSGLNNGYKIELYLWNSFADGKPLGDFYKFEAEKDGIEVTDDTSFEETLDDVGGIW